MNRAAFLITMLVRLALSGMILMGSVMAQSAPKPAPATKENGLTAYVEFDGTADSEGQEYLLNSSVGYNFNEHFGTDIGVPVYFVRAASTATTAAYSSNGVGNPFVDFRLKYLNPAVNFGSKLTGFVPVGDSKRGFSTGRGAFDWTNRVEHAFEQLTPFVEAGIANTTLDSRLFVRPYTTLGFNAHFNAGADYDLWKFFSVGASAYDILPSGQQTVFSRVMPGASTAGNGKHGRVFQTTQQTTGSADIARDDGFSAWIDANPGRALDLELGYTRSMHYDLNAVSFSIGVNLAHLRHQAAP